MCLKIGKFKPWKGNHLPMELRILSFLKKQILSHRQQQYIEGTKDNDNNSGRNGLQYILFMHEFFILKNMYAFTSEFVPQKIISLKTDSDMMMYKRTIYLSNHDNTNCHSVVKKQMFQLLLGLQFLHENGIIHRDIKLSNLVWDPNLQRLVIIDFEHATWNIPTHHLYVGTESFMAPELMDHELDNGREPKPYSTKCDIYSAGMVFGCLLFGVAETHTKNFLPSIFRYKTKNCLQTDEYELLQALIQHNPENRPTAKEALNFEYFQNL